MHDFYGKHIIFNLFYNNYDYLMVVSSIDLMIKYSLFKIYKKCLLLHGKF